MGLGLKLGTVGNRHMDRSVRVCECVRRNPYLVVAVAVDPCSSSCCEAACRSVGRCCSRREAVREVVRASSRISAWLTATWQPVHSQPQQPALTRRRTNLLAACRATIDAMITTRGKIKIKKAQLSDLTDWKSC